MYTLIYNKRYCLTEPTLSCYVGDGITVKGLRTWLRQSFPYLAKLVTSFVQDAFFASTSDTAAGVVAAAVGAELVRGEGTQTYIQTCLSYYICHRDIEYIASFAIFFSSLNSSLISMF